MKLLLGLLILGFSLLANSSALPPSVVLTVGQWVIKNTKQVYYVRVEGNGRTNQEARNNAFRKAVELAVGVVIAGETEVSSDVLIRNDVVGYSSGVIDDFKIIRETNTSVVVDVWVSNSEIANRLESVGKSIGHGNIDGEKIRREWERKTTQVGSWNNRSSDAVRLTSLVLNDYPRLAYEPVVTQTEIIDINGKPALQMVIVTKFSERYIAALSDLMNKTKDAVPFSVTGNDKRTKYTGVQLRYGTLSWTNAYWKDTEVFDVWLTRFSKPVSMEIKFYNELNLLVERACWNINDDFSVFHRHAVDNYPSNVGMNIKEPTKYVVFPNARHNYQYNFVNNKGWTDGRFVEWLSTLSKVEARVIDTANCPQ